MTIGERIKALRKALKLTQQKFADRLHVPRSNLASYEIGKNALTPTAANLICATFGVSKEWLLTGEGEMFSPEAPEPVDHLGELMAQYHVIPEARVLIEKFLELEPKYQEAVLVYARSVAAALNAADAAAQAPAPAPAPAPAEEGAPAPYKKEGAPASTPEEEAAAEAMEYYREILEEKKAAVKSSASSGGSGDVRTA